ncbi:hypothetical protein [Rhodoglobus sp.]
MSAHVSFSRPRSETSRWAVITAGAMRSEFVKLWSLRPPHAVVVLMFIVPVVLAGARVFPVPSHTDGVPGQGASPVFFESIAVAALPLAFLSAILGIIAMTSEYTGDVVAASLSAVPRRSLLVVAKAVPVFALSAMAALPGVLAGAWISSVTLTSRGYSEAGVESALRLLICIAVGCGLFAVLGVACGALMQSGGSATVMLVAIVFLLPSILFLFGGNTAEGVIAVLPASALQAFTTLPPAEPFVLGGTVVSTLDQSIGFLCLFVFVFLALGAGTSIFSKRSLYPRALSARRTRRFQTKDGARPLRPGLTFWGVVHAESVKALSMPSARWLLALSGISIVVLGYQYASGRIPDEVLVPPILPGDLARVTFHEQSSAITGGLALAQYFLAALGALVMTSDFSTGNIRPTVVAVPKRGWLVLAKTGVVVAMSMGVGIVSLTVTAVVVTELQQRFGFPADLDAPVVAISLAKGTLIFGLVSALGCGIGLIARSSAAAIVALALIFIIVPSVFGPLQIQARGTVFLWPLNAISLLPSGPDAASMIGLNETMPLFQFGDVLQLRPHESMAVLALWAFGSLLLGWISFRRRGV